MSNATEGGVWTRARSWSIPLTTTSAPVGGSALAEGFYKITTDAEAYVVVGVGTLTAPDLSSVTAQPAGNSPNGAFHMPAGSMEIVEVNEASVKIAARAKTGTGVLYISGPIQKAPVP